MSKQPEMDASRFVFLDETGSNVAMTRRYGRAPRGHPVYGAIPHNRGKNLTVVAAISAEGVVCHRALEGGMNGASFLSFVSEVLLPSLCPGQVAVLDTLSSHKTAAVRALFAAARVGVLYLPRYAPELNPIEPARLGGAGCWSKIKARLHAVAARTQERLRSAVSEALASIDAVETGRWIRHCGYQLTIT